MFLRLKPGEIVDACHLEKALGITYIESYRLYWSECWPSKFREKLPSIQLGDGSTVMTRARHVQLGDGSTVMTRARHVQLGDGSTVMTRARHAREAKVAIARIDHFIKTGGAE
jgi:hypothetical protein